MKFKMMARQQSMKNNIFSELSETDARKFTPSQQKLIRIIAERELRQQKIKERTTNRIRQAINIIIKNDENDNKVNAQKSYEKTSPPLDGEDIRLLYFMNIEQIKINRNGCHSLST